MNFRKCACIAVLTVMTTFVSSLPMEHACSKFDYEEKLLEKMIRMETSVTEIFKDTKEAKNSMSALFTEFREKTVADVAQLKDNMEKNMENMKSNAVDIQEDIEKKMKNMETKARDIEGDLEKKWENIDATARKYQADIGKKIENMEQSWKRFQERAENKRNSFMVEIKNEITSLKESLSTPIVTFSANGLSSLTLEKGHTFIFENVISNEGGGYSGATGIFTAPYSGLYYFTAHVCNYVGNHVLYAIVVDDRKIISSLHFSKDTRNTCAAVSVVVMVKLNERVWVKCLGSSKLHQDSDRWNSFSGALLHM